jgi:dTDP-4-dehydrorhamnose 3,5-epimerase
MDVEEKPRLIFGGLHVDVRGTVSYVNDFDFKGVDRFYIIRGHQPRQPRGWNGHRRERKWFTVVQGVVLVAVVKPDRWDHPASNLPVERFVLSSLKPSVLGIPPGYASATMALSSDAILSVFSSGMFEHASLDDHRFTVDTWPVADFE